MSDIGENSTANTTSYDYDAYYNEVIEDSAAYSPCIYDLRDFGKVFLPTLYCLVFVLGFAGNSLVVCVVVIHSKQANLTDICLFNLALADLLFVFTLPFYARYSAISKWAFGDFMCRFTSACHNTGFFSSIFFIIVMTVDRYAVIMHTHKVVAYRSTKAGIILSVFVWLLSLCISLPTLVFTQVTNGTDCIFAPLNSAWDFYNIFTTSMLGLLIPTLVMGVCYSKMIPILVNIKSTKRHRVLKLVIFIVFTFILFWAPYNISLFLKYLYPEETTESCSFNRNIKLSVIVTEAFAYTHCCLNPFIYAFVGQRFMKRALHLLNKWMPRIPLHLTRDFSDSSFRKSSVMSRSSDGTSIIVM